MSHMFNFKLWESVVSTAQYGSMTQAAKHLGCEVSTVNRHINTAEKELGFPIFFRSRIDCRLTKRGGEIIRKMSPVLFHFRSAIMDLTKDQHEDIRGMAIVSLANSILDPFLLWIGDLQLNNPHSTIEIISQNEDKDFNGSPVDVKVYSSYEKGDQEHYLGTLRTILCASPQFLKSAGCLESIVDINHVRIVSNTKWACPSMIYETKTGQCYEHSSKQKYWVDSMSTLLTAVKAGIGLGIGVPQIMCEKELDSGELVRVFPSYECLSVILNMKATSSTGKKIASYLRKRWLEKYASIESTTSPACILDF